MPTPTHLFLMLAALVAGATPWPAAAASVEDWRRDLDELLVDVRGVHPDPFVRTGRLDFMRAMAKLKADLPQLSEEQRVVRAMRLIASLGDSHTQLEPNRPDFARWYPVRFYEFSDGYFITAAHTSVAELAGARVLRIAGLPVDEVAGHARDLMGGDNDFARKENLFTLSDAALMKGLGYAASDGSLKIEVTLANGASSETTLRAMPSSDPRFDANDSTFEWRFQAEMAGPPIGTVSAWVSAYRGLSYDAFRTTDLSRPLRFMNRRGFVSRAIPEHDAYYIQSNFVGDAFDQEFRHALEEVDKIRPRRLIVDFRYNFGGDGSRVPGMLREFMNRQAAPPWKELYIVTGRRTLSAGVMAVAAMTENLDNTVIGEPMAAPLNSYGDARSILLARTGLKLWLSTVLHQLGETTDISALAPVDVPAEMSFSDYSSGHDPAVDPILSGVEMRSLQAIALADGGRAARRTWEQRKSAFADIAWWSPPQEIDLRRAADHLAQQKRINDAIETAQLNADVHPDVWNVWYNLGKFELASGQTRAGLKNWARVLDMDPLNANAEEIRTALAAAGVALR